MYLYPISIYLQGYKETREYLTEIILGPGTPESTLYLRSYCSFFILFHSLLVYSVSLFFSFIHSSVPLFIFFNPYSFYSFISSILYRFQSLLISFLHQFNSLSFLIRILISDPSSAPFFIFFNPYSFHSFISSILYLFQSVYSFQILHQFHSLSFSILTHFIPSSVYSLSFSIRTHFIPTSVYSLSFSIRTYFIPTSVYPEYEIINIYRGFQYHIGSFRDSSENLKRMNTIEKL